MIEPSLAKKLISRQHPNQRVSSEAADVASELIRLFVVEARNRAAIQAECEYEGEQSLGESEGSAAASDTWTQESTAKKRVRTIRGYAPIRANHVAKVATDLLLDFS
mmetsp:Transcript_29371/g.87069  ORF Transcript_29371/g.87069 Transcript_29371/m.87069 type:complete len:107 (-) Transcript_29371:7798-8118(-)|eukprot:CAMPEP_0113590154 /NCGR_PEP_ID=MMETSP0015_2-20120614/36510_1 /TAXON_ID=2838 /ORGANISM="Odontella" /LENGTH=106 /DNA_ID=CAMNT_0000496301 /DNA_START=245 /DNA_END=565 /DNA_ORIENTATION=+ /assembly_acc=CAM_ASM_000160